MNYIRVNLTSKQATSLAGENKLCLSHSFKVSLPQLTALKGDIVKVFTTLLNTEFEKLKH